MTKAEIDRRKFIKMAAASGAMTVVPRMEAVSAAVEAPLETGIGMALMEHTIYDKRDGSIVNSNLTDYAVPVNADIHAIDVSFIDKPDPYIDDQGIGARGIGEITVTGVAAALANAVYHATGRRIRELPITPDKLL